MALIEHQIVIADHFPVDPDTNPEILQGQVVTLNPSGNVVKAGTGSAFVLGIAGDSTVLATGDDKNTEYQADLTINSKGSTRKTQNRVSDQGDDTLASGRITVYHSGGKFFSDQYENVNFAVGDALYASANGKFTNVDVGSQPVVGYVFSVPTDYPSGVPGVDTPDNSISLGTYLGVVLRV